jgi:hypothetical protein
MSERYSHVHAQVNPDDLTEYPNGVRVQEIELVLTDNPERPSWRALQPAVCAIDSIRARELAFELLSAAEVAEQWEQAR